MALDMAVWLHTTPRGVEKGSCLNRPAKDVFVKLVEVAICSVTGYKQHLHLHNNVVNGNIFYMSKNISIHATILYAMH